MTEFQSRRELREAERLGLVPKPETVFDLPTGQIDLPADVPSASEMLTRKRIREMERQGLLDARTGAVLIPEPASVEARSYDEVLAETEEPITSTIKAVVQPAAAHDATPVPEIDIFHNMAVDLKSRKPRTAIVLVVIVLVLAAATGAAFMLGIFK